MNAPTKITVDGFRVATFDTPADMLAWMGFRPQHDSHVKKWWLARRLKASEAAAQAVKAETARIIALMRAELRP